MKTAEWVVLLAQSLDAQGRSSSPITVVGTRDHLLRDFKARERGGPLYHNNHQLIIRRRIPVSEALDQPQLYEEESRNET